MRLTVLLSLLLFWTPSTQPSNLPDLQITFSNDQFANQMYQIVSREEGNLLFSPFSLHMALSMLYQGATGPMKDTFKEILRVPEAPIVADGYHTILNTFSNAKNITITVSNKAYIDASSSLKSSFKKLAKEKFHTDIDPLDFAHIEPSAEQVNQWVNEESRGKIPKLFRKEERHEAVLILMNSVYFKGTWQQKFKEGYTTTDPFYTDYQNKSDVSMMHSTSKFTYKDDKELDAEILVLPFTNTEFSMVIILPRNKNGTADLEEKLAGVRLNNITDGATMRRVRVSLPKFKFSQTLDFADMIAEVGLEKIFNSTNNLVNIVENTNDLHICGAVQRVFIHVNENGTEVAATTAVRGAGSSLTMPSSPPVQFRANHPFVFLLTHQKDSVPDARHILFYGRVLRPAGWPNS